VGSNCISCHQREDVHDGQFGVRCEQCHVSENWKLLQSRAGNGFQLQNRQGVTP
jgi:hypothetical protein